jgi:hypothetical protein
MSPHRDRVATHAVVSAALADLSDVELIELVGRRDHHSVGIGGSTRAIRVADTPVFVKLVRLTDLERVAGSDCTENLFALPTYYQYGVGEGSTGFNAWREVAAQEMASGWARDRECDNFPLLYHWRVLPQQILSETAADAFGIDHAVRFWGGSSAIETRLRALAGSSTVAALFLEHIPFVLRRWFIGQRTAGSPHGEAAVRLVERQLFEALGHMRSRGMSHFDAHFDNVLTDGHRIYLSDFGLATSRQFQLDGAERDFVALTSDHDLAYCAAALVNTITGTLLGFAGPSERNHYVRRCGLSGHAVNLTGSLADTVVRYASIATIVNDFYWQLYDGKLTTDYPAAAIAAALDRAGMLSQWR